MATSHQASHHGDQHREPVTRSTCVHPAFSSLDPPPPPLGLHRLLIAISDTSSTLDLVIQCRRHSRKRHRVRAPDPLNTPIHHHDRTALPRQLRLHGRGLPALEEDKRGHGRDTVAARDVVDVVDVDLGEGEVAL